MMRKKVQKQSRPLTDDSVNNDTYELVPDKEIMLTTYDNPYDPFEDWDRWYSFDTRQNYNTANKLASLLDEEFVSFLLGPDLRSIEEAMNQLIDTRPDGFYKKLIRVL